MLLLALAPAAYAQPADVVVVHAKIYTLNPAQPWAQALAISGGHIVFTGNDNDPKLAAYRGAHTEVIDAGGRLLLPGFTDSHIHFLEGSLSLGRVNLEGSKNVAELQSRLKEFAAQHPGGPSSPDYWILGRGWTYPAFGAAALPDKKFIDEVIPDRPVFLEGFDGHTYWANTKAMELAGIARNTPDPPHGKIVRDAHGEATGAFKEDTSLFKGVLPQPSREQKLAALRRGMQEANRAGLVRVHSCGGDFESLDLFDEMRQHQQLTLRMYIAYFLDPPALTAQELALIESARKRYNDDWISGGAVKMMLDGVVESHTAVMINPYADDPSLRGKLFWQPEKYKQAVTELDRRGLQLFTHAIGEGAVRLALDAYQQAEAANHTAAADPRHRIEHIETITAADIPRFGKEGVIASFQPLHAYPDEDTLTVWLRNAGREREPRAFAWQSVAKAGGRLAFGSDWPVVTLNPWQGIQNAVLRETEEGTPPGGWVPAQRLTVAQAIHGYTLGAAIGGRRERFEGSITTGKLADLIIVSQNLFEVDPHKIAKTKVLLTMIGGKKVYQAPEAEWAVVQSSAAGN